MTYEGTDSRLAWCYGDLAIGYTFLMLGNTKGLYLSGIKEKGIEILIDTTKRSSFSTTRVEDSGLCHGTTGLAHIYNRIFQQEGIDLFREASIFWYKRTIEMGSDKNGYAGFSIPYFRSSDDRIKDQYNLSFLTGISGIALGLLSGITQTPPNWDRIMLLS